MAGKKRRKEAALANSSGTSSSSSRRLGILPRGPVEAAQTDGFVDYVFQAAQDLVLIYICSYVVDWTWADYTLTTAWSSWSGFFRAVRLLIKLLFLFGASVHLAISSANFISKDLHRRLVASVQSCFDVAVTEGQVARKAARRYPNDKQRQRLQPLNSAELR